VVLLISNLRAIVAQTLQSTKVTNRLY